MENSGTNFLGGNSFGIQQASAIDSESADLIFGGANPSTNPSGITPLRPKKKVVEPIINEDEDDNDHHINREAQPIEEKFTADDVLNSLDKAESETEEVIEEPKEVEDNNEPDEDDTFGNITKELIKMGIFKQRDEDTTSPVKTGEGLKDRFLKEKEEAISEGMYNFIMSKHGQEGLEAFDAIFVKGVPVKDYLTKFDKLQTFKDMDLSIEDNQKRIFREAYRRQGLAEDKIEKKLQKSIDYGDLEEEITDLHEILIKQEQDDINYQTEQSAIEEQEKVDRLVREANSLQLILGAKLKERELDGIPVTDKVARETYDYLTKQKWLTPSGEKITDFDYDIMQLNDPKNHEIKVKLALLLKNKLDLTKVKIKAVSTESNRVFDTLVKRDTQAKRTQKTTPPSHSFLEGLK